MGTRSISLTAPASSARTTMPASTGWLGALLGGLTALLAIQTGSLALSLTLLLLPTPALLLLHSWKPMAAHGGVWLGITLLNLAFPTLPSALHLPVEAGHSLQHSAWTHLGVLVLQISLLHAVSRLLQRATDQAREAVDLLQRLSPQRMLEWAQLPPTTRATPVSPAHAAFHAHAEHLVRLVSAFSMLRSDMKELAVIAARLRQRAAVQKERSDVGAEQVSRLYDNNDKLSTRAEAIAQTARGAWDSAERILETARQFEEDIRQVRDRVQSGREHVERLFNQLVQVKAAMTAASTIADKICALQVTPTVQAAGDTEAASPLNALGPEIRRQLQHMESTVEELTTAIYNSTQVMTLFQEKVEMSFGMTRQITRSTQALQEENAATAGAIEDLVIQMHASQRQAMDLLSSLEFARNASQEAIAVIENSAQHIVRSEALVEEIDRELVRLTP